MLGAGAAAVGTVSSGIIFYRAAVLTSNPLVSVPFLGDSLASALGAAPRTWSFTGGDSCREGYDTDCETERFEQRRQNWADSAAKRRPFPMEPHSIDPSTADTYLYPNAYEHRPYQQSMVQEALSQNTLVSLPTGTGKTLIAAVVLKAHLRWFPNGLCVFLAMTRPLVNQQIDSCRRAVGIGPDETVLMTGEELPASRARKWNEVSQPHTRRRLIFCTPHILKNDIEKGLIDARRFVCAVFDEAHHATSAKTSYGIVARLIREARGRCRVLALSATAGSTLGKVQGVIDQLHIAKVSMRTEEELRMYLHSRDIQVVPIRPPAFAAGRLGGGKASGSATASAKRGGAGAGGFRELTPRELLLLPGESAFMRLRAQGGLPQTCELKKLSTEMMEACGPWVQSKLSSLGAGGGGFFGGSSAASHLSSSLMGQYALLSALVRLADVAVGTCDLANEIDSADGAARPGRGGGGGGGGGPKGKRAGVILDDLSDDDEEARPMDEEDEEAAEEAAVAAASQAAMGSAEQRRAELERALTDVGESGLDQSRMVELRNIALALAAGRDAGTFAARHAAAEWLKLVPKLRTLTERLVAHFERAPDSRVIVFVGKRAVVSALCEQLETASECRGIVRAVPFVGRSKRADGGTGAGAQGMDQAAQQRAIADFKEGACNVLVATCVAEEGLDIGEVDLIICFDPVNSPTRLVQRMGRTGRAKAGTVQLLLTDAERRQYEATALQARQLSEAVDQQRGLTLKPREEPPLVPGQPMPVFFKPAKAEPAGGVGGGAGGGGGGGAGRAGGQGNGGKGERREGILGNGGGGGKAAGSAREGETTKENRVPRGSGCAAAGGGTAKRAHRALSDVDSSEDEMPLVQRQKQIACAKRRTPPGGAGASPGGAGKTPPRGGLRVPERQPNRVETAPAADEAAFSVPAYAAPQTDRGSVHAPIDLEDDECPPAEAATTFAEGISVVAAKNAAEGISAGAAIAPPPAAPCAPHVLVSPWSSAEWLTQAQLDAYVLGCATDQA